MIPGWEPKYHNLSEWTWEELKQRNDYTLLRESEKKYRMKFSVPTRTHVFSWNRLPHFKGCSRCIFRSALLSMFAVRHILSLDISFLWCRVLVQRMECSRYILNPTERQLEKTTNLLIERLYMHCHPETDCFAVSQLFRVARHTGCFKLGPKPAQLYIRLSILPLSQQSIYVNSGIIRHYVSAFVCLHFALPGTRELNSLEELCITRVAAGNSFARVLKPSLQLGTCILFFFFFKNNYSILQNNQRLN